MQDLFDRFVKEKIYLKGVSPKTVEFYKDSYRAFTLYRGELTEQGIKEFVINMRMAGISPGGANAYIRGINSYLSWLFENGHKPKLRAQQIKAEQKVLKTYTEKDIKRIVKYRAKTEALRRLHTMICLMIDTGCRIDEVFSLERKHVDFDNLLILVSGKGNKERVIPISREARGLLYRYLQTHRFDLVFCTRDGIKLRYDNIRRDFLDLLRKAGVEKTDGSFHSFRRYFAKHYVKYGGNLFFLMKSLGHTTLAMSKKYVEADTEDLQHVHAKTGILARLR
jgi:integrase/recombinase XerD